MINDSQDEPRSLRLVSDNPNAKADREALWAKGEVDRALSGFAAALLRVMAGNQTESIFLMDRLAEFIRSLSKFHEVFKRGIAPLELEEILLLPETSIDGSSDDVPHRRWLREHGMELIVRGALRLAAHKVLMEDPAFGGMHSTRLVERGIKTLEELDRPTAPPPKPRTAKRLTDKWDDATVEQRKRRFGDRLGKRDAFGTDDLKKLRKAIKAKDDKRIAELTAKIGQPKLDDR